MKKLLPLILFNLLLYPGYTQKIKVTEFPIDKKTFCNRLAWIDSGKFCTLGDRYDNDGSKFVHFISVYSDSGKTISRNERIVTHYSLLHNYTLVLGKTIFFFDNHVTEMDDHFFRITDIVRENGLDKDTSMIIFEVWNGSEQKKLNAAAYNFKNYAGVYGKKALLTYNNDYKDPYPEGFQFRTMDEGAHLSAIETLDLPYGDRECNIDDIAYDDSENKIYLICDLFNLIGKNNRTFKSSFLASYDINTKSYSEIKEFIPSFYKSKIQHLVKKDTLIYASMNPDASSANKWQASFMTINKNPFKVLNVKLDHLDKNEAELFFYREGTADNLICPQGLLEDKNGNCIAGWSNFFHLDQLGDGADNRNGIVGASFLAFGLVGALIATAATSGNRIKNQVTGNALWLTYNSVNSRIDHYITNKPLRDDRYSYGAYGSFLQNSSVYCFSNRKDSFDISYSYVNVERLSNVNPGKENTWNDTLKKMGINSIHTSSLYTKNGANYFIGEYDPDNDRKKPPMFSDRKYFLLRIE